MYQWLLRNNGFSVSNKGYFVYCNGKKDEKAFDGRLEFNIEIIEHIGNDGWVDNTIFDIKKCLDGNLPPIKNDCEYCMYRNSAREEEGENVTNQEKTLFT